MSDKPTKFILRPIVFTAVRWSPLVGHPNVKAWDPHDGAGWKKCGTCGEKLRLHGLLEDGEGNQVKVCPGMYVVNHPNGTVYACDAADFEKTAVALEDVAGQLAAQAN